MSTSHLDWLSRMALAWVLRGESGEFESNFRWTVGALREDHSLRLRRGETASPFSRAFSAACAALTRWVLGEKRIGADGGSIGLPGLRKGRENIAAAFMLAPDVEAAVQVNLSDPPVEEEEQLIADRVVRVRHFERLEARRAVLREMLQEGPDNGGGADEEDGNGDDDGFSSYRWDSQMVVSWCFRENGESFYRSRQWLMQTIFEDLVVKVRRTGSRAEVFVPELLEAVAERLSLELFEPKQIGESGEVRATVAASELWQDEGGGGMRTVPLRYPGGVTLLRYTAEREHRQEVEISEAGIRIEVYPHTTEAQRVETIRMRVKAALESRVKYWRHRRQQDAAAKDGEIERQVAPGTEAGDIFQRSFLQEVGKRFPKVLVHLLVVRKECVYRKSEVYMDIDEAQVFLVHHGFIDGPAMDSYFGYLRSDRVENHHLAHRHQRARKGALALLRNRGDWRKGARLVNRKLHGTQPS